MRHLKKGRRLGRTASHRKATMRALSSALIINQRIVTTLAKAKELRSYIEPVITKAKAGTDHARRQVFARLQDNEATSELFDIIVPAVGDRPGGYTRVLKMGKRKGDGAEMALVELVDFNDVKPEGGSSGRKKTRRAGRKKKTTPANPETE